MTNFLFLRNWLQRFLFLRNWPGSYFLEIDQILIFKILTTKVLISKKLTRLLFYLKKNWQGSYFLEIDQFLISKKFILFLFSRNWPNWQRSYLQESYQVMIFKKFTRQLNLDGGHVCSWKEEAFSYYKRVNNFILNLGLQVKFFRYLNWIGVYTRVFNAGDYRKPSSQNRNIKWF